MNSRSTRSIMFAMLALVMAATVIAAPAPKAPAKTAPAKPESGSERAPFSVLGLGIFLGQPTGITLAINLTANQWIDVKAAWDFSRPQGGSFVVQGNYIFAFPGILVIQDLDIPPFVGFGVTTGFATDEVRVAIRVPFGVDLRIPRAPIEIFLEIGLGMYLMPSTTPEVSGGLGIRYRL